jgi:hypothetical protein
MALVKKDSIEIVSRDKIKAAFEAAEYAENSLHYSLIKKPLEF